jgi:hypothetical protein
MADLEDYNVYLEVYTWSVVVKHYMKLPIAMPLMTPYMAQIKFFPNFY